MAEAGLTLIPLSESIVEVRASTPSDIPFSGFAASQPHEETLGPCPSRLRLEALFWCPRPPLNPWLPILSPPFSDRAYSEP